MLRNNFCLINDSVPRRHCPSNSQFLRQIMQEEEKVRKVRDEEILMTSENPVIKEQNQNEEVCRQLQIISREHILEQKRRALLHQNEDEIRELAAQIKRANIQRELIEQKAYKENKSKESFKVRLDENKRIAEELQRNREISLKEERESVQRKNAFRQELLKQMQEKEKQRQQEREMINIEREGRQKLLENIRKDIESEKDNMLKTKKLLRNERDDYLKKVELYRSQQKYDAEEEHRKYLEWFKQRDEGERLRREKRKQTMKAREALSENIGKQVLNIQEEKQQHEDLLMELLIGERLANDDKRHKLNLEQQRHRATNLRNDFLRFFAEKQQEALLSRQREKQIFQEELKIARDPTRAEADTKNLNIPSKKQYREDLVKSIEYKKCQREFEAQHNKAAFEQELALKKKRQQEIEAEKLRLLKAEPLENFKFLPPKAVSEEHRLMLGLTCKETKEDTN